MKFSGAIILQGVEFSIFLLVFERTLQQCSATALPVIDRDVAASLSLQSPICRYSASDTDKRASSHCAVNLSWKHLLSTADTDKLYLTLSVAAVSGILLPAALRAAQICRYLVYSEADFEVFRPAGATRCTDGVKIGTEEGTEGPLLHAKFHPHRCNDKGVGPPKLKFLLRFDRNV